MLYEDLAGHAAFDGILFHDDLCFQIMKMPVHRLSRLIKASGLAESERNSTKPEQVKQWTRFKSRALTDFTLELSARVKPFAVHMLKLHEIFLHFR